MNLRKTLSSFLVFTLLSLPLLAGAEQSQTLWAGQNMPAGTVIVSDDGTTLTVSYQTNEDWALTETHLHVAKSKGEVPQTKTGNPKIGNFAYSQTHDPAVAVYNYYILLADLGVESGDELIVAAHAVVAQAETIHVPAPYYGAEVISYEQGKKSDGTDVDANRSVPEQGLEYEMGQNVSNFFSLGFGGGIVIGFEYPILNGPGNDIRVIEDTWGSYPEEKAEVFASQDGVNWFSLGFADNAYLGQIHTFSEFDLSDVGLDHAYFIKVVDVSDPALYAPLKSGAPVGDGYDLNAVEVLQDYHETILTGGGHETAWAAGDRFTPRGSWATYFSYEVQGDE
jgi:hypothetical protein